MADGIYDNMQVNQNLNVDGATTLKNTSIDGNLAVNGQVDGVDISDFKADYDSKINQNVKSTASPVFAGATVNGNITVTGTVDGQDLSTRLNQNVKTTDNVTFNQGRFNNILRVMRESYLYRTVTAFMDMIVHGSLTILNGNLNIINGRITGNGAVPVGATMMWWDDAPPAGYLECNNDLHPIASYPDLFAKIGDKFGKTGSFIETPIFDITGTSNSEFIYASLIHDEDEQDETENQVLKYTPLSSPDVFSDSTFHYPGGFGIPAISKDHAFDNNRVTSWLGDYSSGPSNNSTYITYKFDNPKLINGYALELHMSKTYDVRTPSNTEIPFNLITPEKWVLQGSNNNVDWADLDDVEDCDWSVVDSSEIYVTHRKVFLGKKKIRSGWWYKWVDIYTTEVTKHQTISKRFVFDNYNNYQYYKLLFFKPGDKELLRLSKISYFTLPYVDSEYYHLYDNNSETKWMSQEILDPDNAINEKLKIQLETIGTINSYEISCNLKALDLPFAPAAWELWGTSNSGDFDLAVSTRLDTQTNIQWLVGDNRKTFYFTNSTAYQYYWLVFKGINGGDRIQLSGIRLFSQSATHFAVPAMENAVPRGFHNAVKRPFEILELHKLGSAICSSIFSASYLADYAFNEIETNFWCPAELGAVVNGVGWIGKENITEPVKRIWFKNYSSANNNVSSIKLQYSTDNKVTWNDIQTWSVSTTANAINELDITTPYISSGVNHAFRLLANSGVVAGCTWAMKNIKIYSHVKQGAMAMGSALYGNCYPDSAFNVNPTIYWVSNETGDAVNSNSFIGLDFGDGNEKRIKKIVIVNGTVTDKAPSSVKVQYSNDNITWFDISIHDMNISENAINYIFVSPYLPARYIRVLANAALATGYQWIISKMYMIETYFEDPDMLDRYNVADGTTGQNIGTIQNDALKGHFHPVRYNWTAGSLGTSIANAASNADLIGTVKAALDPIASDAYGPVSLSTENRMKNVSCMFIIKH